MAGLFVGETLMAEPMRHTFTQQAEAARRELKLRQHVYPRRVGAGQMSQKLATEQIAVMESIVETLERLAKGDLLL